LKLLSRFSEIEERYEQINQEIADPSVISDRALYTKLTREHSELREMVAGIVEFKASSEALEEARSLLGDSELGELAKEELPGAEKRFALAEEKIKNLLAPADPLDGKDIILEIRAGTGGDEAALFAADLFRMYQRYAEFKGWKVEVLSSSMIGLGGIKEIIVLLKGTKVYGQLKFESGVHRVQRVPETESSGRIHTSAVTVAVMPEADDIDFELNMEEIRVDVFRASGAGGQHVNKTESAVRLTHLPTGVIVSCQDGKSQHKNKAQAMKIMKARLFEKLQADADDERSQTRKELVGSGDRSERIRTYNFPQGRITDHRIGLTIYKLQEVLQGELGHLVDPIVAHAQAEALAHGDG
jgi:peptide chain release factor 1